MAIFFFLTGLAILILGIRTISRGLSRASGPRLRRLIRLGTKTPFLGMISGTLAAALSQSSSLITVLLVSLVNAGLLSYRQAFGAMLGANIGTTFTIQLIAFSPEELGPPLFLLGLILSGCFPRGYFHYLGTIMLGCGSIFIGFNTMSLAFWAWRDHPDILRWLTYMGQNQYYGILGGALITGILQSSSLVLSMVAAMTRLGLLDLTTAIALCLGANVGTCVTSLLASLGTGLAARRTAFAHLLFNVWGVLLLLPILGWFTGFVARTAVDPARQVANAHTLFNVATALLALPLTHWFVRLVEVFIPDKK
ncbi:MAG: Na/Pi cotransporter family protein [Limnochordia bacterium]|jgi:phosphate:Na+ symporter